VAGSRNGPAKGSRAGHGLGVLAMLMDFKPMMKGGLCSLEKSNKKTCQEGVVDLKSYKKRQI